MDAEIAERARAYARRYVEIIERFDLCPWAAPAGARGEVWIAACDEGDLEDVLARFAATPTAVVGLVALPGFAGDLTALRRLRGRLNEAPIGRTLALAEFHPDAPLDTGNAQRLIPYLRRSPDPMLQAVRHETLASLRKGTTVLDPAAQAAILAGQTIEPVRDIGDRIADTNFERVQREGAALAAALDELIRARRAEPAPPA
ncbi:MAG: hypothetical protein IPL61_34700 [Myxococcales bacterium]|nr:hypothetical protein [Myxococcales bacterium]